MRASLRSRDAWPVAEQLTDPDRYILGLLVHFPFLWAEGIVGLAGRWGAAMVYVRLRRLEEEGLIATVRVSLDPGRSPRFFHLTDLGVAVIASASARDPLELAREKGIRRSDLRALLPSLAQLRATYRLLVAVVTSRPSSPTIVAWDRSWCPGIARGGRAPLNTLSPAHVIRSWDRIHEESFLLVADRASFPVRAYRDALGTWLRTAISRGVRLPPLVIATLSSGRAMAWDHVLRALGWIAAFRETRIITWDMLSDGQAGLGHFAAPPETREYLIHTAASPRPPFSGAPHRPIPCPIDVIVREPATGAKATLDPGDVAATLTPADRSVLDLIGRHPFLDRHDLAQVLSWSDATARDRCARLVARGLLFRHAIPDASRRGDPLLELTVLGLRVLAAHQGLTLPTAVRCNGLAGGGPESPVGTRQMLWSNLRHTRGVDAFFVELATLARRARDRGGDDALLEWRNAEACTRGPVRPDGYGIYRQRGQLYGFFLEYDRATATGRDYRAKFAAYHRYRESGRSEEEFTGFPTILVVTTGPDAEERIARAVQTVGQGRLASLPMLITTISRITSDAESVLGPVWRETGVLARRRWIRGDESVAGRGHG